MEKFKVSIILFFIVFIVVSITYYTILKRKLRKQTLYKSAEISFLVIRYNLNKGKVPFPKLIRDISIINAFIIAFTSAVVTSIPVNVGIELAIGFVLVFALIYSIYEIYGRKINKKWGKKK